jgi:hypothetical protein
MTILEQINQFSGSHIIGIDTLTEVKLTGGKSNPLQGKVTKLSEGNRVMLFKSGIGFKNMVNKKLEKQNQETLTTLDLFELITGGSTYEPGPRPWGQRIPNSPFVEHKGKQYLEVVFVEAGTSRYFIGDREIDKSEIAEMLPNKTEGVQGGLRDKVIIRTFAIDSIVRIRKSGNTIPVNETH